jgi:peroxiredoxin
LLDFEKNMDEYRKDGIEVIAASTDSKEDSQKTADKYKVTFGVGYGLDAKEVSAQTGAFYDRDKGHLHAAGFILAPDGMIANAVYSTGPVGRLVAEDTLALIRYLREQKQ